MGSIFKRAFTTGLLVSLWLVGGFTLLSFVFTSIPHLILRTLTGVLGLVVLFTGIYYAMRAEKQKNQGILTYTQALKTGLFISVITAVMVSIASGIYVSLNPSFAADMVREAETSLKASGASATVINQKTAAVYSEFSVARQMVGPLIVQTVMGGVFSLIVSAFIKSTPKK
jgi:uncharacterized protein with PQ loop repeat